MARSLKQIEQQLLHLPQAERARLAHRLIVSLDEDIEATWIEETKRRDAEIEHGDIQPIPAEEAMRRVADCLKMG